MPANSYAVRITHPAEIVKRICSLWALRSKRLVCYQHDDDGASNIHCHIIIEEADIEKKQLRNIASEVADVKGNSRMSFRKEYDGAEQGFSYMTKGKYNPVYLHGWTVDDHEKWKAAWVEPAEYVKQTHWRKLIDKFKKEETISEIQGYAAAMQAWYSSATAIVPQRYDWVAIQKQIAKWVFKQHQGIWDPKAAKDYQVIKDTLFIEMGYKFPDRCFDENNQKR